MRTIEEIKADIEDAIAAQDTSKMNELYREKALFYARDIPLFRLNELCQAERAGLAHIGAVKDGTPIFYHSDFLFGSEDEDIIEGSYLYGYTEFVYGEINKGWHLTREEAENALKGEGRE